MSRTLRRDHRPFSIETLEERRLLTAVVDRYAFYNQSAFDGDDPAINALDDSAIATDKSAYLADVQFTVEPLTNNATFDSEPRVRGDEIIWMGRGGSDAGSDDEIFFYNGSTVTQLTVNSTPDRFPELSALGLAWERGSGTSQEIVFYNGSETPLTSNAVFDGNLSLGDNRLSWENGSGTDLEIYTWTGAGMPTNLSNIAGIQDLRPYVDGNRVVWIDGDVPAGVVKYFNGTTTTTVGTSVKTIDNPRIDGSIVTWESFDGNTANDREIYYYNGTQHQLTDNAFPDWDPQISGANLVWYGGTFNDTHVYLWNGLTTRRLSTGFRDEEPQIDGENVVWQGFDGNDYEIFLWNGHKITQITDNDFYDTLPQISGNHIVWQGGEWFDGTTSEIYHAHFNNLPATPASVTSYSRGLNGIMIDVDSPAGTLSLDDFTFRVSNPLLGANNAPLDWNAAPMPSGFDVRPTEGAGDSDRVVITWADGAIAESWLEVIFEGNDFSGGYNTNTGLADSDIFFFGNKIGDTFLNYPGYLSTDATDQLQARFNQGLALSVENAFDFSRDALVDATDQLVARNNQGFMIAINIGSAPAQPGPLPEFSPAAAATGAEAAPLTSGLAIALSIAPAAASSAAPAPAEARTAAQTVPAPGVVARYLELVDTPRPRRSSPSIADELTEGVEALLDDLPLLRRLRE
jgi:hypothetical protein